MIRRIVSGGQTGADRAALDAALIVGIECGGWVPKGRQAEDGVIPATYPNMAETESDEPRVRTELNVRDSDATLVVTHGAPVGGTEYTIQVANRLGKPLLHVDLNSTSLPIAADHIMSWLQQVEPHSLNIAGPRHSEDPKIYELTKILVSSMLLSRPVGSTDTGRLQTALTIRSEAGANFRHWDQVRWLVPYWFCVLSSAVAAFLVSVSVPLLVVRVSGLAIGVFGILCLYLVARLGHYHNRAIHELNGAIADLVPDSVIQKALTLTLPFRLQGIGILRTATFWFSLYVAILVAIGFFTAYAGIWWSPV